ncbi:MAG: DNA alkylation repair protein [Lysobacterales bacterium]
MAIRAETGFSLKDDLFNETSVAQLAAGISTAWPSFPAQNFRRRAAKKFPELELKQRIMYLVSLLDEMLPDSFPEATDILRKALPSPLDPSLTDDDFGQFIWAVPGEYVARNGCTEQHLDQSLQFLQEATQRFSSELAIRPFLKAFPKQTMSFVRRWTDHSNYHVRRLASEGIRPLLPWALRVVMPQEQVVRILNRLYRDPTRYVVRSVANTLNDLSKSNPERVIETLERWHKRPHADSDEMNWLTRHALRTLVKSNNAPALELLGYPSKPAFALSKVSCSETVKVGNALHWSGSLRSKANQRLKIFLCVYFRRKDGSLKPTMFTVKDLSMSNGEVLVVSKQLPFRPMTTRTLYPGEHAVELVVNGSARGRQSFQLVQ